MEFNLDDYIDHYVQNEDSALDRKTALHLKKIIPRTTHLDENVFKEMIEKLIQAMDKGSSFKDAFNKVSKRYVLIGDAIEAELPSVLNRLILNDLKFLDIIAVKEGFLYDKAVLVEAVNMNNKAEIEEKLGNVRLSNREVVFATFDEHNMEANPFANCSLRDIIDRLALDTTVFWQEELLTAVSIRYRNRNDIIKRFPVFTDAGWHYTFWPCNKFNKYGETKPLNPWLKPMPEIVHKNLKMADIIVEIQFLEEENMSISSQESIDKILSFTFKELKDWIESRLKGNDKYFPIREGYELNLHDFLAEAYHHIDDEDFKRNFLEILDHLILTLRNISKNKKRIEENKEYIYEAVSLFRKIRDFKNKSFLYRFARNGNFKGIEAYDVDLHQLILNALASHDTVGDYNFWLEQMQDDSNKSYTNTAFYALLKRKYTLDIIFRVIGIFIDRFKDDANLVFGIRALFNNYGKNETINQFKAVEHKLSEEQKQAVDKAFIRMRRAPVFQLSSGAEPGETGLKHPFIWPGAQVIEQAKALALSAVPLPEKAVKIFKWMDFQVELNREIAGHSIDAFIKKKNISENFYEYRVCFFDEGKRKTGKDKVREFYHITEAVKKELKKESPGEKYDDVRGLVVSEKGFTKEALGLQEEYLSSMDLLTLAQLFSPFFKY